MDIFSKASKYIEDGKVFEDGVGPENEYYAVGQHSVNVPLHKSLRNEMVCTCTHGSLSGLKRGALCCHKIAVIAFKTVKFKKRSVDEFYFKQKVKEMTKEEFANWVWNFML